MDNAEEVQIELGESGPLVPPADVTGVPVVVGCCADGPYVPRLINSLDDLMEFKGGAAPALSAAIVAAGRAHILVRAEEGVPGTYGPVVKSFGNPRGAMMAVPGATLWAGLSANGQLIAEALSLDVSLQMYVKAAGASLVVPPVPAGSKNVIVELASDPGGKETSTAGEVLAAVAAVATAAELIRLSLPRGSDGKGIVKNQGAAYVAALNDGAVAFQALQAPLRLFVSTPSTASQPLKVTFAGGTLTISNGTNPQGLPVSSPTDWQIEINARSEIAAAVSLTQIGTGRGLGALSVLAALPFGSDGECLPLGRPIDRLDCVVQVVRGGVVGIDPPPTVRWSLDDADSPDVRNRGGSWGSEMPVPANGVLALADELLPSGVKIQLSKRLDSGDTFRFPAYGPEPTTIGLMQAIDRVYDDPSFDFGFMVPAGFVDAAQTMAIDSVVQLSDKPPRYRHTYAIVNSRDQGAAESDPDYERSLGEDFFGIAPVDSAHGLTTLVNGWGRHRNPMAQRWQRRPASWYYALTRATRPAHEQPGDRNDETGPGSAQNFGFSVFYHDANRRPGLRLRGRASSVVFEKNRGWFATEWRTLAPPSSKYLFGPWMSVIVGTAAILQTAAVNFKLDSIDADDRNRIAGGDKNAIAAKLGEAVSPFLYGLGRDSRPNARRNPPEIPLIVVEDNYDVVNSQELRVIGQVRPMPFARMVKIRLLLSTQPASE